MYFSSFTREDALPLLRNASSLLVLVRRQDQRLARGVAGEASRQTNILALASLPCGCPSLPVEPVSARIEGTRF